MKMVVHAAKEERRAPWGFTRVGFSERKRSGERKVYFVN
jgi:hypothetical protein